MPHTFSQVHLQIVFAVKFRAALIKKHWKDDLEKYITGIVTANRHKMIQINCQPDHIHFLIGYNLHQLIPTLVEIIKLSTMEWIRQNRFCRSKFQWQQGNGVFSYSKEQLPRVIKYIQNQDEHHRKKTFRDEYDAMLKAYETEYEYQFRFNELQ